jgi:hypothetical protein
MKISNYKLVFAIQVKQAAFRAQSMVKNLLIRSLLSPNSSQGNLITNKVFTTQIPLQVIFL